MHGLRLRTPNSPSAECKDGSQLRAEMICSIVQNYLGPCRLLEPVDKAVRH